MKRLLWLAIMASAIVAPSAQAPAQAGLDAAIASINATIAAAPFGEASRQNASSSQAFSCRLSAPPSP